MGRCTVSNFVPSGKVPSTWTSWTTSGTPGRVCLLPSNCCPVCISSATPTPSRIFSSMTVEMRPTASGWFSLKPRARRFWAKAPTWCNWRWSASRGVRCNWRAWVTQGAWRLTRLRACWWVLARAMAACLAERDAQMAVREPAALGCKCAGAKRSGVSFWSLASTTTKA